MKKATVEFNHPDAIGSFVVLNARGKIVSTFTPSAILTAERAENDAQMAAHYYRMSTSAFSRLKFRKIENTGYSSYSGRVCYGVQGALEKTDGAYPWAAMAIVDDGEPEYNTFKTREAAAKWLLAFGNLQVMTRNILNPDAGEFPISRSEKGGCCDPGTETYHSM